MLGMVVNYVLMGVAMFSMRRQIKMGKNDDFLMSQVLM